MPPPMMKSKALLLGDFAKVDAAAANAVLVHVPVEIAVSSSEQSLDKWLEMRSAEFHDGANVVGEQVALCGNETIRRAIARRVSRWDG